MNDRDLAAQVDEAIVAGLSPHGRARVRAGENAWQVAQEEQAKKDAQAATLARLQEQRDREARAQQPHEYEPCPIDGSHCELCGHGLDHDLHVVSVL